jgi:hypothetical protein
LPAVSKDAAPAAPRLRPWFETRALPALLTVRAERVKIPVQEVPANRGRLNGRPLRSALSATYFGYRSTLALGSGAADLIGKRW